MAFNRQKKRTKLTGKISNAKRMINKMIKTNSIGLLNKRNN